MKRQKMIVALFVAGMLLLGSGLAMAAGSGLPGADGKAVYDYITKTNPYQKWAFYPGKGKLYEGKHPHGALLTTYVSADALKAIEGKAGKFPDGAIIVKENYMADKTLDAVTVMYRVKGFDAEAGDWFWAKYSAKGNIDAAGKVGMCSGCHTAAINNDWVFTGPVK